MRRERSSWETLWQELKELVRPDTADFANSGARAIDSRRRLYDGTAPWALDQLAAGLHSHLTNPVDRWFSLGVAGTPFDQLDHQARLWLELSSDILYAHYSNPFASFNPALHEGYMDLGGLGTAVLYEWLDVATNSLRFRAYPLADCWIEENSSGIVDTIHRRIKWNVRQVEQEFGRLPPKLARMKPEDKVEVLHCVYPRTDRDARRLTATNRPFASVYYTPDTDELLHEGGYNHMPYHTPRWTKLAGEMYGRAPSLTVLPDIRMVNAMSKTVLVAAHKIVDPPLLVPDDGFQLPIRQTPGGINFFRSGTEEIKPLISGGRVDIGVDMIEQRRETIRRGFYVDWLVRQMKKERQTAQEIMDERNQMLSMMAPVVGRLQGELLGPIIRMSYDVLAQRRLLPDMPASLDGAELDLLYVSPAARAQSTVRGQGVQSYIAQLVQLLPVMPNLIHSINEDNLNSELQDLMDVPRRIINDPATIEARRKAAKEQQAIVQATESVPAAAKSAKDFAQARQLGLPI